MDIANELNVSYSAVHRVVKGQSFNGGSISQRTGRITRNRIEKEFIREEIRGKNV